MQKKNDSEEVTQLVKISNNKSNLKKTNAFCVDGDVDVLLFILVI